jgi:hypothetical protein
MNLHGANDLGRRVVAECDEIALGKIEKQMKCGLWIAGTSNIEFFL